MLLAAALLAFAALAAAADAKQKREEAVYLSLGTSLAAGAFADANGDTVPFSDGSYTDLLHTRVRGRVAPKLEHIKLGCAGESAETFVGGGIFD
jgi:hypothetical protein